MPWRRAAWRYWLLPLLMLAGLPHAAPAQTMDHYSLLMAFLPGQCLVKPELPLCEGLTLKDPAARNLTLIGLRPDPRSGSVPLRDCDPMAGAFSTPLMDGDVETPGSESCAMPPLKLSDDLAKALKEVMPSVAQCAERRFWSRYGACSMLSEEMYFERAVGRAKDLQKSLLNVTIASSIGSRVKRDTLVAAFTQQFGEENAAALQLVCGRSKKKLQSVLTEVRIKLNQLGTMRSVTKESLWQESGAAQRHRCPEEILIPEAGQPVPDAVAKPKPPGTIDMPQMPVVPSPEVPEVQQPTVTVPEITAPKKVDPTKPQPMDTEPTIVIPPLSE